MAKNSKQSSSVLTRCFRSNKIISTEVPTKDMNITSKFNTCPLSSVIQAIQTIDQMVQSTENNFDKQQGDSHCIQTVINIEQIEEMLIKWTHIAHFLIDAYQQTNTSN